MSTEDLKSLAVELNKPAAKRDWIKIFIGLSGFIMVGYFFGDWHNWRSDTDKTLQRHETLIQSFQKDKNTVRAEYNKNVPIK